MPSTLCWGCKNACGWCSWSRESKPVDGWTATRKDLLKQGFTDRYVESYVVHECPEFVPDRPKKPPAAFLKMPQNDWTKKHCPNCASLLTCAKNGPICKARWEGDHNEKHAN